MMANYMIYRVYYRVFGKFRIKIRMRKLLSRKLFSVLRRKKNLNLNINLAEKTLAENTLSRKRKINARALFDVQKLKLLK